MANLTCSATSAPLSSARANAPSPVVPTRVACRSLCSRLRVKCSAEDNNASSAAGNRRLYSMTVEGTETKKRVYGVQKADYLPTDSESLANSIGYHAEHSSAVLPNVGVTALQAYKATAASVRERVLERWNETNAHFAQNNVKQVAYISMEFLQGRALLNAVNNLGLRNEYTEALQVLGYELETVAQEEQDAALGNGGLGRLASCFLDSLATLDYPGWGYGLRYKYGLFRQKITDGTQYEEAENWLDVGNPWEVERLDTSYTVKMYGRMVEDEDGEEEWVDAQEVVAVAFDTPIPGYKTNNCINLRLWDARPAAPTAFDLAAFNAGDYGRAYSNKQAVEDICAVLYPGDGTPQGKELRLKQQYLLCSATLQDLVARFKERTARAGEQLDWEKLPEKVVVQLNDTHPTLGIPELMRILVDEEGLDWDRAWAICTKVVAYTNHTVMPEALEKWPYEILARLLPRHMSIIHRIDEEFVEYVTALAKEAEDELDTLTKEIEEEPEAAAPSPAVAEAPTLPKDTRAELEELLKETEEELETIPKETPEELKQRINAMRIIESNEHGHPVRVHMANMCVIAGFAVNGVAAIHSEIVKDEVFNEFYQLWPEKFQNKTNGVTPRRWLSFCNQPLSALLTETLGSDKWITETSELSKLAGYANDPAFQEKWRAAKRANKEKLVKYIKDRTDIDIPVNAMFDIQVKRIHEYKRQLLNILGVVLRYKRMKEMTKAERLAAYVPRVVMFGGKAYATYVQAKRIVKFINKVGEVINNDPEIGDLLKVVFVPDYNVSVAENLIPASELSQHISTAGTEASGTSNMKFSMNGCVIIGTLDGANVEIREEVGEDNFFLFGKEAHEITPLREQRAAGLFEPSEEFVEVCEWVKEGTFGVEFAELIGSLEGNEGFGRADWYCVGADFPSYMEAQERVDAAYRDTELWTKMSIMNTAGSGKFSSDRTIEQYANEIWDLQKCPVPQHHQS